MSEPVTDPTLTAPAAAAPRDDATTLAIRVRGLTNTFGEQVVHDDLDLDVRRGEILGVVGGSGSGKSVLMRAILSLRRPQGGQIEVLGVDALSDDRAKRFVGTRNIFSRRKGGIDRDSRFNWPAAERSSKRFTFSPSARRRGPR